MRKFFLLAVFSLLFMPITQVKAATIEDGTEICTKKGCKMLLNILPTPISSIKTKKQCKVTWAVDPESPGNLFSVREPLPKKGCKTYMSQNLGRWWRVKARANTTNAVFLEPIPVKYDVWR